MPVKNTASKKAKVKKIDESESSEEVAPTAVKSRMPIDFDSIPMLEEKAEVADPLLAEEEVDELSIDDDGLEDEIDPFGDKWEA